MNRLVALMVSALTSVAAAQAQEETLSDGMYVRLGGGVSFASDWTQNIAYNPNQVFPAIPAASAQTLENGQGFVAGAAVGFDYTDGIRTELEYRYASTSIDSVTFDGGARLGLPAPVEENVTAHFVMSNFFFDFYNSSPITPFIGGGVGGAFVTNENGARDAALAYQGRAGLAYALGGGFSADLEYIYLRTNDLVYGPADEDFTATGPSVRLDGEYYQSFNVMLSIRKQF